VGGTGRSESIEELTERPKGKQRSAKKKRCVQNVVAGGKNPREGEKDSECNRTTKVWQKKNKRGKKIASLLGRTRGKKTQGKVLEKKAVRKKKSRQVQSHIGFYVTQKTKREVALKRVVKLVGQENKRLLDFGGKEKKEIQKL